MSDEKIASIMRDFVKVLAEGDVEKTLSYYTDNGVWITPDGTFTVARITLRYTTSRSSDKRNEHIAPLLPPTESHRCYRALTLFPNHQLCEFAPAS